MRDVDDCTESELLAMAELVVLAMAVDVTALLAAASNDDDDDDVEETRLTVAARRSVGFVFSVVDSSTDDRDSCNDATASAVFGGSGGRCRPVEFFSPFVAAMATSFSSVDSSDSRSLLIDSAK